MQSYKQKIKSNLFLQNIAIVASGNVAAKIIGLISAPIITRIYSPDDFGIYSIFVSIIVILGAFATLRYAITIPLADNDILSDNIIKLCIAISISYSLIVSLGSLVLGSYVTNYFSVEHINPYLWFIPIALLGKGIYETLSNWAVRVKKFKLITKTKVTQGVSSSVIKIGLGLLGFSPSGLIIGQISQEAAGIGNLASSLIKFRPELFKSFSLTQIKEAANRYKKFPLIQSWSQLLLSVGTQLPILLIGYIYGLKVVGVFGLAQNMINMPMDLLGQSVAQVYYAEISKFGKGQPDRIYNLSISIIKRLLIVGVFPVILLILFGPYLFKVFFGAEWIDAGVYAQFLSILILTRFISAPIMNCLNVLEIQGIQLWLNVIRIAIVIIVFSFVVYFDLAPKVALFLYSVLLSIFYIYVVLRILYILKRLMHR